MYTDIACMKRGDQQYNMHGISEVVIYTIDLTENIASLVRI